MNWKSLYLLVIDRMDNIRLSQIDFIDLSNILVSYFWTPGQKIRENYFISYNVALKKCSNFTYSYITSNKIHVLSGRFQSLQFSKICYVNKSNLFPYIRSSYSYIKGTK
jgi:hypothetical protein